MALNFPDNPTTGQLYTDSTAGFTYQWDGVVWKSYTAAAASNIRIIDDIESSFNGSTTTFALTSSGAPVTPVSPQQLRIVLGGIVQEPAVDYNVAGSNIIFTTAPATGLTFSGVLLGSAISPVGLASTGSVYYRQSYSPTGVQTTFTVSGGYRVGYLDVYHNGVKLVVTDDYTATNGSTFDLVTPANNGDTVEAVTFLYTQLYSTTGFLDNLFVNGNATVTGITTLGNTVVGGGTTQLLVNGDARVTGILTVGTSSITLDGVTDRISVGTGLTLSSAGIQAGVVTATTVNATTITGAVTGNATGLSGSPSISVTNITGVAATFTGNVSIAGTLTYEDVTNVDSIGIVTARSGAHVATVSGNLLVGTTSDTGTASQRLQVTGNAYVSTSIGIGTTNPNGIGGQTSQLAMAGANTGGGAGYHQFLTVSNTAATNPNKFFRLNSTGGIEIVNSAYTTVLFSFTNAGDLTATGNVTGYSDETLKDNIQTIPDALDKVIQLRGVEFDRKDIEGNPHQIGVIAQEVEKVIPEVVMTHEDGIKSVAYGNLVGLLIEAIKELKEEVNELKARLEGI